jgi:glycosyltransferase involved in cell wall biosynthesis
MATFNGENYVSKQMASILMQLSPQDEVIVIDDCSTDQTLKILESFNDLRIKIYTNDVNKSHVYSFARSISLANNDIIFMADQDDIWMDNRIDLMKHKLIETGRLMISSNSDFIDMDGNKIDFHIDGVDSKDSSRYLKNILAIFAGKTNYYGCAMAFHKKLKDVILPIPKYVESHDLWIAMAGNLVKANLHLDERTIDRRIHGNNASVINRGIYSKIRSRVVFVRSLLDLFIRIRRVSWSKF